MQSSQAGQLVTPLGTSDAMPIKAGSALWGSLLLAYQIHQNVSLAETAVERFVELEADDSGVYVLLSNKSVDAGMWEDALKAHRLMEDTELKKEAGRSIIEVDCDIHEFVNGEKSLVQVKELHFVIQSLSKMHIIDLLHVHRMLGRENPENKILSMDTGKQTILGAQAKIHDCDQTSTTLLTDWLGLGSILLEAEG
ncbi:hypothetical protein NC652_019638 [Populus alba x Populus x berolinensis]|nr:hypothetical protein NC652_019638 [Populus alba x Populus x berolinensis]